MKKLLWHLWIWIVLCLCASLAQANPLPYFTGPQDPALLQFYLNTLVTNINTLGPTQEPWQTPRNFIDNGDMLVDIRGTGIITCGTTTAPETAYSADRWTCNANVTSGAGRTQVTTATPAPPPGFIDSLRVYRNSGALTQPVCVWEELPTSKSTALAGQAVIFSSYEQALAGLAADNGNVINLVVVTGTGAEEGLQTFTASPAITPAWTGIATPLNQAFTITTAWQRYSTTVQIPTGTTEVAVAECFTPTATGAGVTDGFAFTGAQFEAAIGSQAQPSPYEFLPYPVSLAIANRYFYRLTETAAITPIAPCSAVDTTHTNCLIQFPVPMRIAPTMTYTNGFASPTSTTQATLGPCTTLASAATVASTVANPLNVLVNCTATTIPAAGVASFLYSNGGAGVINAAADF